MYGYGSTATANLGKRKKFANPERVYGLAKGRQTDSKVGSQVHASKKKKNLNSTHIISTSFL